MLASLLLLLALPAVAEQVVVEIDGMTCAGCEAKITGALEALPFVKDARASFDAAATCVTLGGALDEAAVRAAVEAVDYTVRSVEVRDCPPELRAKRRPGPWDDISGVDVRVVSHGEEVDLQAQLVPEHFTVIDFGAAWCGPCHTAADTLAAYLRTHDDVAVRAIELDAPDPKASFALPVARQHLALVPGLPWFEVYDASGRRIYKGGDVAAAIDRIDRRRP